MTNFTVGLCGLLYLATCIGFVIQKQWSWSIVYFAYALANVGLILAANGK